MPKYETRAGYVTKDITQAKLLHLIKEAEDCCYTIAHLHRTESGARDELLATGWRAMGQMLALVHHKLIELAKGNVH